MKWFVMITVSLFVGCQLQTKSKVDCSRIAFHHPREFLEASSTITILDEYYLAHQLEILKKEKKELKGERNASYLEGQKANIDLDLLSDEELRELAEKLTSHARDYSVADGKLKKLHVPATTESLRKK